MSAYTNIKVVRHQWSPVLHSNSHIVCECQQLFTRQRHEKARLKRVIFKGASGSKHGNLVHYSKSAKGYIIFFNLCINTC